MECRLKNNPFVKVSCNFSRVQVDEKIYQELETVIEEINRQDLTAFVVESALKLAVPVNQWNY
ncbi:MAG: hypothetical protein HEQ27_04995 [Dolichospermum sp. JUN01]|nr:hypothetical protein [Dolichospermum sp. JUN01]